jgi:HEAT repeat protein
MKRFFFLGFLSLHLTSYAEISEESYRKRIYSHLLIADATAAAVEAELALKEFPQSKRLQMAYLQALCEKGMETQSMQLWQEIPHESLTNPLDRKMLEMLAWGVLKKGESSSQLNVSLNAMLGGAFTRDAKAIPMLLTQLRSSNALLRSVAVRIAPSYGDAPLKEEMARLLKEEKVWYVRLDVIASVGRMRLYELKPQLKEIIADPRTLVEEKSAAIVALVSMYDSIEKAELRGLVSSDRAGLRQLAAEIITHLQLKDQLTLLLPLLKDSSPDVRVSALNTLALLRIKEIGAQSVRSLVEANMQNSSAPVAITAAYILLLNRDSVGEDALRQWIRSDQPQWARLASAAVSISGQYGLKLALREFQETTDPYVKVNLAKGLIGQRTQVKMAAQAIHDTLSQEKQTLWMWQQEGNPLFSSLAPSQVRHIDFIPNYPAVVDQMVRLDLLSMLSIVRYPKAQEAVKEFLQTRSWGITGAAAATLIQEGDEEDLAAVKGLLTDPDENIRCQAALILAIVGSDPSAVKVLQETYPHVDREMKVHILEALAHIGDPISIPFLVGILQEPFQILRVVAASALIQCLYH